MRSVSRYGDRSRDRSRGDKMSEKRSESKDSKKEYKNCIGCKYEECVKMRKNAKELNVQLCDGFQLDEEILVNFTEKGKQVMILDLGAPVSLAGKEWMEQYLKDHELELSEMRMSECYQIFKFGPSKKYVSTQMVELPVIVRRMDGKEDVLKVFTYLVDADFPFLCGKRTMVEKWN